MTPSWGDPSMWQEEKRKGGKRQLRKDVASSAILTVTVDRCFKRSMTRQSQKEAWESTLSISTQTAQWAVCQTQLKGQKTFLWNIARRQQKHDRVLIRSFIDTDVWDVGRKEGRNRGGQRGGRRFKGQPIHHLSLTLSWFHLRGLLHHSSSVLPAQQSPSSSSRNV